MWSIPCIDQKIKGERIVYRGNILIIKLQCLNTVEKVPPFKVLFDI